MSMPVYVISLPDAQNRQTYISKLLKEQRLNYEIFPAVDGRTLQPDEYPGYNYNRRPCYFGRHMKGGEIGCTLSHKSIYELMLKQNITQTKP